MRSGIPAARHGTVKKYPAPEMHKSPAGIRLAGSRAMARISHFL